MSGSDEDKAREKRIDYEVIVDAYTEEEQAMGWYYYLEGKITFPFQAECIAERSVSPLKVGEKTDVVKMVSEDDCLHEPFVLIEFMDRTFGAPLVAHLSRS
jgi:hypothetical protein